MASETRTETRTGTRTGTRRHTNRVAYKDSTKRGVINPSFFIVKLYYKIL